MPNFSRSAKWLTNLFTPSVAPTTGFPDRYSQDISLTQGYDGGGWGIPDIESTVLDVTGVVGASVETVLLTAGLDEIVRVVSAAGLLVAGLVPTTNVLNIQAASAAALVSNHLVIAAAQFALFDIPGFKVLLPGMTLRNIYAGGDVLTQQTVRMHFLRLPLGTIPVL